MLDIKLMGDRKNAYKRTFITHGRYDKCVQKFVYQSWETGKTRTKVRLGLSLMGGKKNTEVLESLMTDMKSTYKSYS
jgi:hypothetical protein